MEGKLPAFLKCQAVLFTLVIQLASCWSMGFPDSDAVKYDDKPFNTLANDIVSQNQIYQRDDFTRYTKRLNGVYIKLPRDYKKVTMLRRSWTSLSTH